MLCKKIWGYTLLSLLLLLNSNISFAVIDGQARDYIPLPPGTNLSIGYFQHYDADKFYSNGTELPGTDDLSVDVPFFQVCSLYGIPWYDNRPTIHPPRWSS